MTATNRNLLGNESSPYLLQHKDNPIWWLPWSEAAFVRAEREDKPIFLSVGYATCHWCHVMEGDSFINEEVAAVLNDKFVCIKVDREERPDVDTFYMAAVQAMTHHGGWPMSVFLTPDRKPFWAGTFIPRQQFIYVLGEISKLWNSPDRGKIVKSGADLTLYLGDRLAGKPSQGHVDNTEIISAYYRSMAAGFDPEFGGFSEAPKFPSAMHVMTLFKVHFLTGDKSCLSMGIRTLDALARGGIHDHLGGGFHRYSTDAQWLVPHFEKMTYDNALIILAFCDAFQITAHGDYRRVIQSTCNYIMRDLTGPEGQILSAEDADSEQAEGKFYVWQEAELQQLLSSAEFSKVKEVYSTTPTGNFSVDSRVADLERAAGMKEVHDANILFLPLASALPSENDSLLASAMAKLAKARSKRVRPLLDDKSLTSWSGLAIAALARAARVLSDANIGQAAQKAARFALKYHRGAEGRGLLRCTRHNTGKIPAFLDDYSGLIFGLIELFQTTGESAWLESAQELQVLQDELFWDRASGCYFDSDGKDATIIFRTREFGDNAAPSGNSLSALNLAMLASLTGRPTWQAQSRAIVAANSTSLLKYPQAFPFLVGSCVLDSIGIRELAVDKSTVQEADFRSVVAKQFLPHVLFKVSTDPSAGGYQVCRFGSCEFPESTLGSAIAKLKLPDTTLSL